MKLLLSICLLFYSSLTIAKEPEFTYLEPKDVPDLPLNIIDVLETKKCLIPRWHYEFGGVAKGEFAIIGQNDTAVICANGNRSKIIIFWGGPDNCPTEIDSAGQFINTVDKKYILEHYATYGGNKPPEITHQAINDVYIEKGSIVKYCHNGEWIELTGAD